MSLHLFEKFVKDEGLFDYLDDLFEELYICAAEDFDHDEDVFLVVFGGEYSVSVEEFYQFSRTLAEEAWFSFVGNWIDKHILEEGYKDDCDAVIEKIDTLIHQFIEWLRTLDHDKLDAELVTKLLTGEVSERDIALKGLAAYLHTHCA